MSALRTLAVASAILLPLTAGTAFADLSAGVDADPEGNTATSLGEIDSCVEVSTGDTFQVDIYVRDVDELIAFQGDLQFDPAVIRVVDRDVQQILASTEGSDVFDSSDQTPGDDGRYTAAAVNTTDSPQAASGSGVLARVTLEAVAPGISSLSIDASDINGDGTLERGLVLRSRDGTTLGDENQDGSFDGPTSGASVAVDSSCSDAPASTNDDDSSATWVWIAVAAAIVVGLTALAAVLLVRRRGSA